MSIKKNEANNTLSEDPVITINPKSLSATWIKGTIFENNNYLSNNTYNESEKETINQIREYLKKLDKKETNETTFLYELFIELGDARGSVKEQIKTIIKTVKNHIDGIIKNNPYVDPNHANALIAENNYRGENIIQEIIDVRSLLVDINNKKITKDDFISNLKIIKEVWNSKNPKKTREADSLDLEKIINTMLTKAGDKETLSSSKTSSQASSPGFLPLRGLFEKSKREKENTHSNSQERRNK